MPYLKRHLLVWWITLVVILAGSLMPLSYGPLTSANDASDNFITMEICGPKGERLNYTITFEGLEEQPLHHDAHCLFCILPFSVEAIIDSESTLQLTISDTTESITFPTFVHVPTPHDRWLPHRALAPPVIV